MEFARLMARILDPEPGQVVHKPCCESGGLLIKAHLPFSSLLHHLMTSKVRVDRPVEQLDPEAAT